MGPHSPVSQFRNMLPHSSTPSIREYVAAVQANGVRVLEGSNGTFWTAYESWAMARYPTFHIGPVAPEESTKILWRGHVAATSYLLDPDKSHPANASLYMCSDPEYSVDKLAPAVRRNIRRGYNSLKIEPISATDLLANGMLAFCDTRKRIGLSDGTPEVFQKRFTARAGCIGHGFLGAWKDHLLAAFLSVTEVDDWVEIEGCFSANAALPLRANDALMAYALSHYMESKHCRLVSYGLSSIQSGSNLEGLHRFKTKVGFQARRVHRAFTFHPVLRPFLNRSTQDVLVTLLRWIPGNPRLKKIEGVLAIVMSERRHRDAKRDGQQTELKNVS